MAKQKAKKKEKESSVHHTGRLEITRNGTGFVSVEGLTRDVKIRPQHLSNALDGDEVAIELVSSARSSGRLEGIVTKIIRRGHEEFSGTLSCSERFAFLIPDKENMPVDIFIPLANLHEGKDGDKAVVRIVEWPEKSKKSCGRSNSYSHPRSGQ
jgi:Exoribonuclease R